MEVIVLIVLTIAMFMVFDMDSAQKRRKSMDRQLQGKKNNP